MPSSDSRVTRLTRSEPAAQAVVTTFEPRRLTIARHRSGLTKAALARAVGLSPAAVTQFESGTSRPSARTLGALADALDLPVTYLAAGRPVVRVPAAHFRSLRSTRLAERLQALALVGHTAELVRQVERHVVLPPVDLPVADDDTPDQQAAAVTAAQQVRAAWNVPDGPFPHLIRTLEAHGVVVVLAEFPASTRVDAFSCVLSDGRPVICLSRDRGNVLRRRFTAAHELGHLVLGHDPQREGGRSDQERQANMFAAEILAPAAHIASVLPSRVDLARLLQLRELWGMSVSALLYRSREVNVISENSHRQAMIRLTQLGWRRNEPQHEDLPGEWPALLTQALALAGERGLSLDVLVARLNLPHREVADLLGVIVDERPRLRLLDNLEPAIPGL